MQLRMSSVEKMIEPLRHSPQLPQAIAILQAESRVRGVKFEDFATNGVSEYWLVDAGPASEI